MDNKIIKGQIVDLFAREIYPGQIEIANGIIINVVRCSTAPDVFIMPGLIDSHVHIESSMLTPSRFARMVVPHGTIGAVTDPHEIANVLGREGVQFMIDDGKKVPFKFFFGAPSCVPATPFETSGASLNAIDIDILLNNEDIYFLSEMMNFPGVIQRDNEIMAKLSAAKRKGLKIDGHAPGLRGKLLEKYIEAGIGTDHECASLDEALEKISLGMKIQIREGSAARNFQNLSPLFKLHPEAVMLCTDDSHPDEILTHGHINRIIKKGVSSGVGLFDLLKAATINPVMHYNLPVGLLRQNDTADFIVLSSLENFTVEQTYINGTCVYNRTEGILFPIKKVNTINAFRDQQVQINQLEIKMPDGFNKVKVIEVEDGELLTNGITWSPTFGADRIIKPEVTDDVLKLVVVNRYSNELPAIGFVRKIGLKTGALASSVAHDSHNIIAVGVDDFSIAKAINKLIETKGGIVAINNNNVTVLELPVAGLMSTLEGEGVAAIYQKLNYEAAQMGTTLKAPFMTLSFLSLLVIPSLKLGDKGLFDVNTFSFTSLFE